MTKPYKFYKSPAYGIIITPAKYNIENRVTGKVEPFEANLKTLQLVDHFIWHRKNGKLPEITQIAGRVKHMTPDEFYNRYISQFAETERFHGGKITQEQTKSSITEELKSEVTGQKDTTMLNKDTEFNRQLPTSDNLSYKAELKHLKEHANSYLTKLGMYTMKLDVTIDQLMTMCAYGDVLVDKLILDNTYNTKYLELLRSNVNMKLAMIKLGFVEFSDANTHLSGTFYEFLLYAAYKQDNKRVFQLLKNALVGGLIITDEFSPFNKPKLIVTEKKVTKNAKQKSRNRYTKKDKEMLRLQLQELISKGVPKTTAIKQLGLSMSTGYRLLDQGLDK